MGSSASILQNNLKNNPEIMTRYRKEFTDLFLITLEQLKNENLTEEEINHKFEEVLKENELKLISRIAEAEQSKKLQKDKDINPVELQHIVNQSRLNYQKRNSLNFLVCINGTDAGDIGFKSTLRFMNKYDTITIFHAYNSNELEHIPLKYQPKQIRDKYYSQLINLLPSNQFFFYFIDYNQKDVTNAIKDYLLLYNPKVSSIEDYLKEYTLDTVQDTIIQHPRPDFLVVGSSRVLLKHSESGISEDSRPITHHHHKNTIRRINSGPVPHTITSTTTNTSPSPSSSFSSTSKIFDDIKDNNNSNNGNNGNNIQQEQQQNIHEPSVNAFMAHSHPPYLTKSSHGQSSGAIVYQDLEQDHNQQTNSNSNEYTILGTNDLTLQNIYLPCIIMKSTFYHIPQQQQQQHVNKVTYIIAVNESNTSKRGLDILKKLLNPKDTLRMVYMSARDTPDQQLEDIRNYYNKEAQLYCPSDSSLIIIPLGGRMMIDVILNYANEIQTDFIAVSPRANKDNTNYSVSLTEQILSRSNCNVIICKN